MPGGTALHATVTALPTYAPAAAAAAFWTAVSVGALAGSALHREMPVSCSAGFACAPPASATNASSAAATSPCRFMPMMSSRPARSVNAHRRRAARAAAAAMSAAVGMLAASRRFEAASGTSSPATSSTGPSSASKNRRWHSAAIRGPSDAHAGACSATTRQPVRCEGRADRRVVGARRVERPQVDHLGLDAVRREQARRLQRVRHRGRSRRPPSRAGRGARRAPCPTPRGGRGARRAPCPLRG